MMGNLIGKNASRAGVGTFQYLGTVGDNGGYLKGLTISPLGTNNANLIRLYIQPTNTQQFYMLGEYSASSSQVYATINQKLVACDLYAALARPITQGTETGFWVVPDIQAYDFFQLSSTEVWLDAVNDRLDQSAIQSIAYFNQICTDNCCIGNKTLQATSQSYDIPYTFTIGAGPNFVGNLTSYGINVYKWATAPTGNPKTGRVFYKKIPPGVSTITLTPTAAYPYFTFEAYNPSGTGYYDTVCFQADLTGLSIALMQFGCWNHLCNYVCPVGKMVLQGTLDIFNLPTVFTITTGSGFTGDITTKYINVWRWAGLPTGPPKTGRTFYKKIPAGVTIVSLTSTASLPYITLDVWNPAKSVYDGCCFEIDLQNSILTLRAFN
jgi:hypothetical protein